MIKSKAFRKFNGVIISFSLIDLFVNFKSTGLTSIWIRLYIYNDDLNNTDKAIYMMTT